MCTVSILMPAKNAAFYLKDCLNSIIEQTFIDWELIVINDHSTDDTEALLQSYVKKDSRITYYNNPGSGIIPALQKAYLESSGKYLTRMDADDLMTADKLVLFVNKMKESGPGFLTTALVKYVSDKPLGEGYLKYAAWLNALTLGNNNFSEIYKECTIPSPNWMIHREDLEKCGGFNSDVYPEDYDLAFRFRAAGLQLSNIRSMTHLWRDHPTRASRNDENYSDNKFVGLKIKHFIDQDYNKRKALVLWGAGPKGKAIAKELSLRGIAYQWVCNNSKKIGHNIYGVILEETTIIKALASAQIIIGVSQQNASEQIEALIDPSQETFWFH